MKPFFAKMQVSMQKMQEYFWNYAFSAKTAVPSVYWVLWSKYLTAVLLISAHYFLSEMSFQK